jgi:hypothetical protein
MVTRTSWSFKVCLNESPKTTNVLRQRVYRQSFKSSIFMHTSNLLTHKLTHVSLLPSTMSTISKCSSQVSSWSSTPSLGVQYRMEYFSLGGDCAPFIFGCSYLLMNTILLLPIVNLCILHLIFHVGENNTISKFNVKRWWFPFYYPKTTNLCN